MSRNPFKTWWDNQSPTIRRMLTAATVVVGGFSIVYYIASGKIADAKAHREAKVAKASTRSLLFDGDSLERDLYDRVQADMDEKSHQLDQSRQDMEAVTKKLEAALSRVENLKARPVSTSGVQASDTNTGTDKDKLSTEKDEALPAGLINIPPPPAPPGKGLPSRFNASVAGTPTVFASDQGSDRKGQQPVEQVVGGILHVEAAPKVEPVKEETKEKKFYLPPSFMEATLLSGMDAHIGGKGMENPKPAMLRIAAPAVLPNRVRANLKDCFVVASGYGSLAEQRINFLLSRLACVGKDGQGVIDEKIQGYIADSDSKFGVKGRAVFKGGGLVARQLVAGAAEGAARALTATATVTNTSALGATQVLDQDKITRGAIGGAGASGFQSIADMYKELVKQTMPFIEIGAKKKVTVVITEGVYLKVSNYCEECGKNEDIYAIR